jgi:hypothetical protein
MRMIGMNCDGKGSNKNHHFLDMSDVYEVCRTTGVKAYITMEVHHNFNATVLKYVDSLRVHSVTLAKEAGIREQVTMLVHHILFREDVGMEMEQTDDHVNEPFTYDISEVREKLKFEQWLGLKTSS